MAAPDLRGGSVSSRVWRTIQLVGEFSPRLRHAHQPRTIIVVRRALRERKTLGGVLAIGI
jgi:hypothetical protein